MESTTTVLPQSDDRATTQGRSTVQFPYSDLDAAIEVVRGVHNAGGTACDSDQLAAEMKMEAKGGGFRMRITGAQTFGLIVYERGGRISLTDLGRQIIDSATERQARVSAFLTVELYAKVYEQFKGGPLPPQAGLERAIGTLGVGAKVRDRARQVLLRSAKQGGFFEAAADRLVKPSIKTDTGISQGQLDEKDNRDKGRSGGGGGNDDELHPLIRGLLQTLPAPGGVWGVSDRLDWLNMANSILKMIYKSGPNAGDINITIAQKEGGGTNG
ncbi:hypothetical protein [Rhodanobacter sp. C03]|uniref:hypothetical protein n=1 Tax=Rhodanobacter sp. C03 TaxID=1945858 RepID=UPI001115813A|nr:hypothetical protein [Rhodanobacter sp. C03]